MQPSSFTIIKKSSTRKHIKCDLNEVLIANQFTNTFKSLFDSVTIHSLDVFMKNAGNAALISDHSNH